MRIMIDVKKILGSDKRTALMRKNIALSFLIKGWSGVVTLLLVRVTLEVLGGYKNGIWLTISSMLIWIDNLDIGLGNGLRNILARHLAHNEMEKARTAVSSTFAMLVIIIVPAAIVLTFAILHTDLYELLNVDQKQTNDLLETVVVSVLLVCCTFVFKFIGNVYMGLQLPAANNLIITLGHTLQLLGTIALMVIHSNSLLAVAIVNTASPVIVYLIFYPITFYHNYPHLRPNFHYIKMDVARSLMSLGIIFFVLQISSLLITMTTNLLISRYYSPEQVVPYNISWRYFTIAQMFFSVICAPYWSATTDAYARGDITWIRKASRQMDKNLIFFTLLIGVMTPLSPYIYPLLTGNIISIPLSVTVCMALYITIILWCMAYCFFLNGMGVLRMQLICTVGGAVVYIPLALTLIHHSNSVVGILIAMSIVNLPSLIVNRIQFEKIISRKAKGIWLK